MPTEKSLNILLWLVAMGFFMQTLDSAIVNTAMAAGLGESPWTSTDEGVASVIPAKAGKRTK